MELNRNNIPASQMRSKTLGSYVSGDQGTAARKTEQASSSTGAWLEKAYAYRAWLLGVIDGSIQPNGSEMQDIPADPTAYLNELDNQIRWTLGLSESGDSWDPLAGEGAAEPYEAALPAGAKHGTIGNIAWTGPVTEITFDGEKRAQDIWSEDVVLNVADLSVDVRTSITTDTRWKPPVQTLKVEMTDKATGQESVYFIHDYDSKKHVTIRTPDLSEGVKAKVDAINAQCPGLMTLEKYDRAAVAAGLSQSNVPAHELVNGERVWKKGNAVQYFATPGKETDRIYLDAIEFNVADRTQTVNVTKTGAHAYTIEVFDPAVSTTVPVRTVYTEQTDTILFKGVDAGNVFYKNEFDGEDAMPSATKSKPKIQAKTKIQTEIVKSAYTKAGIQTGEPEAPKSWEDYSASPDDQIVIESFTFDGTKVNASGAEKNPGEAVNPDGDDDTIPTEIDSETQTAVYKNKDEVELTAQYSDDPEAIEHYEIEGAYDVTLNKAGEKDRVEIVQKGENDYEIKFRGDGQSQVFHVTGDELQKIVLDASVGNITYKGMNDSQASAYQPGMDPKISVKGEPVWPADIVKKLPLTDNWNMAEAFALFVDTAIAAPFSERKEKWQDVLNYMAGMDPDRANDALRIFMTALDRAAAAAGTTIEEALKLIDPGVRQVMFHRLWDNDGERDERRGDEKWNSMEAAALLRQ